MFFTLLSFTVLSLVLSDTAMGSEALVCSEFNPLVEIKAYTLKGF